MCQSIKLTKNKDRNNDIAAGVVDNPDNSIPFEITNPPSTIEYTLLDINCTPPKLLAPGLLPTNVPAPLPVTFSTPKTEKFLSCYHDNVNDRLCSHEVNSFPDAIPDMSLVLYKFGIHTNFRVVPLRTYLRTVKAFVELDPNNISISQRIRTMVRTAKNTNGVKH